jgi:hypothetical protein
MSSLSRSESGFFEGEPRSGVSRLRVVQFGDPHVIRKALLVVGIGWAPLFILSCFQSFVSHSAGVTAFLTDVGAQARFLIAAPLFVLAEQSCAPRLGAIGRNFGNADLVPMHERSRFDTAIRSTGQLLNSPVVAVAIVTMAYVLVLGLARTIPSQGIETWHQSDSAWAFGYSPAGWWHVLVSLPLLIMLMLGWLWRLVLWARFLWLMARLDLRLNAAHPDHVAGLRFVGHSLRAFAIIAFALGAIVAGQVATAMTHRGASLNDYVFVVGGLLVVVVLAFVGPLLIFVRTLLQHTWRGVLEYGALADRMGQQFERKWFRRGDLHRDNPLAAPDFSATIDLYSIVSNVYAMRPVPIDVQSLTVLVTALLLPFLPVVLMEVPVSTLISTLRKLVL